MRLVPSEDFRKLPDGTLFTGDSADPFVAAAVLVKGKDDALSGSAGVQVYERDDLKALQEKVEFALALTGHKAKKD